MKWQRVLAVVLLGLLMLSTTVTAQGLYFENEGYLVPSENSQSVFDSGLTRATALQAVDDRIEVIPDAGDFPEIVVTTTIRGANGNPIPGVKEKDVTVTEQSSDENEAVVETLTCFEAIGDETAVSFSLALDVSYSMSADNKLTEAKAAANVFLDAAGDADQGSVVSFAGCRQVFTPFALAPIDQDLDGDGVPDIRQRIDELTALGSTAVYDGISQAVATIAAAAAPKGVVALTDGMTNNDCTDTINSVIEKARTAGVPVYTIGFDIPADSAMAKNLRIIAEETGGTFSLAPTPEDLSDIYLEIAGAIRAQYRICYTTHNPALDGTTRTVTVNYSTEKDNAAGTGTYTVGSVPGNQPPVIVHDPVTSADKNTKVTIEARVTDPDPGDAVDKVSLFFRGLANGPGASFIELDMTAKAGGDPDLYAADIPAGQMMPPGVEYYIFAWDKTGGQANSGRPDAPYFIEVTDQAGNQPPVITHDPVTRAHESTPVTIEAQITDPDDAVEKAALFFRVHGDDPDAPFAELSMTAPDGGDLYSAVIPENQVSLPGVDYYISAWDGNAAQTDSGPYFIQVTSQPIADAGPDQVVDETETVTLDGSASSSGIEGETLTFSWRQSMGPVVALSGASTARPTFEAPVVDLTGTVLIFELKVTDSLGAADTDTVWVTIEKGAGCRSGDCGSGSGGCFIDTVSAAPGWLRGLFR